MKGGRGSWIVALAVLLSSCSERVSETTEEQSPEPADEWVSLFDGKTFAGWRGLGRGLVPEGHWVIEQGTLRKVASGEVPTAPDGQPLKGGDLLTEATWLDFELALAMNAFA